MTLPKFEPWIVCVRAQTLTKKPTNSNQGETNGLLLPPLQKLFTKNLKKPFTKNSTKPKQTTLHQPKNQTQMRKQKMFSKIKYHLCVR